MPDAAQRPLSTLPPRDVWAALETSSTGLSPREAEQRLARYGPNSLRVRPRSLWPRFVGQFTHFLAVLLWTAAGLAFLAAYMRPGEGMAPLGGAIVIVIVLNAIFAFVQEYRAERAVEALHLLLPPQAWTIRGGQSQQIPRTDLVPGDLMLLEEGEQVPADARLVEAIDMRVDNSPLTGESHPKRRTATAIEATHDLDAANLVFAGTTILSGHGQAVVTATGMETEFGKVAHLALAVPSAPTPLQQQIVQVTHIIAIFSLAMGGLFFVIGVGMGLGFWVSAVFGIGIIVANVPEGLLPTVTLALAMGSQRMAKQRALIKHLPAVETLGCTTVICTDKTGTLTTNKMTVDRFYIDHHIVEARDGGLLAQNRLINAVEAGNWRPFFDAMIHCNNAKRIRRSEARTVLAGDPTEAALLEFADAHGLTRRRPLPRMRELAFDADRKRMTTLHWAEGRLVAFVKGSPESVLPRCSRLRQHDHGVELGTDERQQILMQSRAFAEQAYRVLAVAMREIEQGIEVLDIDTVERDLTFLGLVALMDPPHREVPEALARTRRAGIRTIMITGDHPLTAHAVAQQIGLIPQRGCQAGFVPMIDGSQLDGLTDEQLRSLLTPFRPGEPDPVFARMTPRQKMRIVSILKDMGEIVAVTGDGVNDAPALKKADIGIAMGIAGTDVAKASADLILLDDNFATIVNAIEEGRAVYANIRKFVTYVLASNVPEIVPYLGFGLLSWPLALTVPQILAVDLGTDMLPALALGAERPHAAIMDQPPRPRSERLLDKRLLLRAYGFLGPLEATIAMGGFFLYLTISGWSWSSPLDWSSPLYQEATTVTLSAIVVAQVANVFACRSEHLSVAHLNTWDNPLILIGILVETGLLLVMVYTPVGHWFLGTAPLPIWIWGVLGIAAAGLLLAEETRKGVMRHLYGRPITMAARPS